MYFIGIFLYRVDAIGTLVVSTSQRGKDEMPSSGAQA
jgi:hypothetical protein